MVLPFGGPLLASLSLSLPLLACFPPLSNSFILQDAFLVRVPDWLRYVEVGLLKPAGGEGPPPAGPPGPMNLLARLEPAAIWNAGLFMEPGGCGPGPDPANLEAISSWAKGY